MQPMYGTRCSVCLGDFGEGSLEPKVLACGHTFCRQCCGQLNTCAICQANIRGSSTNFKLFDCISDVALLNTELDESQKDLALALDANETLAARINQLEEEVQAEKEKLASMQDADKAKLLAENAQLRMSVASLRLDAHLAHSSQETESPDSKGITDNAGPSTSSQDAAHLGDHGSGRATVSQQASAFNNHTPQAGDPSQVSLVYPPLVIPKAMTVAFSRIQEIIPATAGYTVFIRGQSFENWLPTIQESVMSAKRQGSLESGLDAKRPGSLLPRTPSRISSQKVESSDDEDYERISSCKEVAIGHQFSGIFTFSHLEAIKIDKMKKRMIVKDAAGIVMMIYVDPQSKQNMAEIAKFKEGMALKLTKVDFTKKSFLDYTLYGCALAMPLVVASKNTIKHLPNLDLKPLFTATKFDSLVTGTTLDLRYVMVQYVSPPQSLESSYNEGEKYEQVVAVVRDAFGSEVEMAFNSKCVAYTKALEVKKAYHFMQVDVNQRGSGLRIQPKKFLFGVYSVSSQDWDRVVKECNGGKSPTVDRADEEDEWGQDWEEVTSRSIANSLTVKIPTQLSGFVVASPTDKGFFFSDGSKVNSDVIKIWIQGSVPSALKKKDSLSVTGFFEEEDSGIIFKAKKININTAVESDAEKIKSLLKNPLIVLTASSFNE